MNIPSKLSKTQDINSPSWNQEYRQEKAEKDLRLESRNLSVIGWHWGFAIRR